MAKAPSKKNTSKLSDPSSVSAASPEPSTHRTGAATLEFDGHMVNTRAITHVTRPASANAGSHDSVAREDGSAKKDGGEKSAKLPAWRAKSK